METLVKNTKDFYRILDLYHKEKNDIWKDYYRRMLQSYQFKTRFNIREENIKELKNLTKAEELIDAKPFIENRRKDRNTNKLGMIVTPAMQVCDAYQNYDNKSYREGFHSKKMLAIQISNDGYKYNEKLFKKYSLEVPN